MNNCKDNRCKSLKTSNRLVFAAKLLNDCLLTTDVLLHRYKGIDLDSRCTFCQSGNETLQHLVKCNNLSDSWKTIIQEVFIKLKKNLIKTYEIYTDFQSFINTVLQDPYIKHQATYQLLRGLPLLYMISYLPT